MQDLLAVLLLTVAGIAPAQTLYFSTNVPSNWSAATGSLAISTNHYKCPTNYPPQCLQWNYGAGDILTVTNPGIPASGVWNWSQNTCDLWVYNPTALPGQKLTFQFADSNGNVQFFFDFYLNYTGWRQAVRSYRYDMSVPPGGGGWNLAKVSILGPTNLSGQVFFDAVAWVDSAIGRNRDLQNVDVGGYNSATNYYHAYYELQPDIPANAPTASELNDLAAVRAAWLNANAGGAPSGSSVAGAYASWSNLNLVVNGSNIMGQVITDAASADNSYSWLQTIALDAYWNHTPESANKLNLFLRHWWDQGMDYNSGVAQAGGSAGYSFRTVPTALILGYPAYDGPTRQHAWQMFQWLYRMGHYWSTNWLPGLTAGGADDYTLTDDVYLDARRELGALLFLAPDDMTAIQYLKGFKRYLERFLTPSFGTSDGLKVDGLGFHHNAHYNAYMYALPELSDTLYLLRGTGFEVNSNAYVNLRSAFFAMLRMANTVPGSASPGYTANSLCGRHPFSTALPFDYTTLQRLGDWGGAVLGQPADPLVAQAYNRLFAASFPFALFSGYGAEPNPTGFYQYNYSPIGLFRQANWVATLHGLGRNFWGSEIYATENRYGRYQSYGACEILYPGGNPASGFGLPGWDWNKPPGSTTIALPWTMLEAEAGREDVRSALNFSGALAFRDGSGLSACNFQEVNAGTNHNPTFAWRKSWFCFTNQIICLGSSITNNDALHPTITTLFQGLLTNPAAATVLNGTNLSAFPSSVTSTTASANWLVDGCGTGYFVRPGATLRLDRAAQSSPDQSGSATCSTNNYATAWLNHGTAPANAGYEYVVVPGASSAAMAQLASNYTGSVTTPYTVLESDATAHVVQWKPDGRIGYALFTTDPLLAAVTNAGPLCAVSLPCLAMTQPLNSALWLRVVNPDLNLINNVSTPTNVDVTLAGNWSLASGPASATVLSASADATVLRLQTVNGLPVEVLLLAVSNSLTAPATLAATVVSTNQIDLAWTAVTNATGYVVRRGGVAIANVAGTTYSDTGLLAGTTCTYTVLSTNANGTSPESMPVTATTPTPGTTPTAGSVLSWDADFSTAGDQDGSGTWNAATLNWLNGGGNVSWVDNCAAVFGASPTTNCTVTLGANVAPARITVNAGSSYTLAGNNTISTANGLTFAANGYATVGAALSGSKGLTNAGTGTLTLSGPNSYTGGTTVNAGTLNLNNDQSAATGGWTVASGIGNVNFNPGSTVAVAGGKSILLGGNSSSGSTLTVAGTVANNGTLTVSRRGTLNLNRGANWLQSGAMSVAPTASTGYSALMTVNPGATFSYTGPGPIAVSPSSGTLAGGAVLCIAGGTWVTGQGFTNATVTSAGAGNIALSTNGTLRLTTNIANLFPTAGSASSLTLGAGGGVIDTAGFATTLGTAIGGSGSLTKLGTGTLTLSASNSFTGATLIGNGTLALAHPGALNNSAAISLAAGATLDLSALSAYVLSSKTALSAAGTDSAATITGAAAGTINLGSQPITLTYDGVHPALVIAQGTLVLNSNAFTVNSSSPLLAGIYPIMQQNGGSISSSGACTVSGTAIGSGMNASIWVSDTKVNLVLSEPAGFSNLAASQVIGYGAASVTLSGTVSGSGPVYPAVGETVTVSINGNVQTATIADATGDFSLNYDASTLPASAAPYTILYAYGGNAYLSAASDTSRTLLVNKASPVLAAPSASPISSGQTLAASTLTGGTASNANNGDAVAGSFAFTTPGITPSAGTTNVSVTFTPADTTDYNPATTTVAVLVVPARGTFQWDANLAAAGAQDGSGIWDVTAANWLYNSNNLAWFDHEVAVFGAGPATNCMVTLANDVTPAGITVNAGSSYTLAGTNSISTADGLNIVANGSVTLSAVLSGSKGLTNAGTGTLTLSATNSYTGGTTVNAGTVNVNNDQSAATGGWALTNGTAKLNFNPASTVAVAAGKSISLGGNYSTGGTLTVAGAVTNNGTLTVSRRGTLNLNRGANWLQNGAMSVASGFNSAYSACLTVNPGATFSYAGPNPISVSPCANNAGGAVLTIAGGTWVTGQGFTNATVTSSGTGNIAFSTNGTLRLTTNIANLFPTAGSASSLTLGGGGGVIDTAGYSTTLGTAIGGSGSLTKLGAGSLTLSASNSFTGATLVGNGTLALANPGALNNSAAISLAAGATLDLSALNAYVLSSKTALSAAGTDSAATITGAAGGTVNLGSQPITLTYDGVHPALAIAQGTLLLNSNAFTVNSSSPLLAGIYPIVQQNGGSISANGTCTVSGTAIGSGTSGSIWASDTNVNLVISEPAALSNLAASQAIGYGTTSVTLSGTVSGSGPVYPAVGETVTVSINGNVQTATITDATGDFSLNYDASTLPASAAPYTVLYAYGGNAYLSAASDASRTLLVNKASPILSVAASPISYGQTLGASSLSGSTAANPINGLGVAGSFAFPTPGITPNAGTTNVSVTFTPVDLDDYNLATATLALTVGQATPRLTAPAATAIAYGQTLAASALNGGAATNPNTGAAVAGSFAFTTPGIMPDAGTTNVSVTFTPADSLNYNTATTFVAVWVAPVGATFQWDVDLAAAGAQGGSGSWSVTATNWLYNSNNLGWFDHEVAVFGGSPGSNCMVTLGNDVTPAGITFNAANGGSYTIAGTNAISTADGLNLVANGCGILSAPLVGTGGVTITGSGSLSLCGTNSYRGATTVGPGGAVNVFGDQSAATGGWTLASDVPGAGVTVTFNPDSRVAVASTNRIALRNSMLSGFSNAVLNIAGTVTNNGALDVNRLGVLTLASGASWSQNGALFIGPGSSTSAGSAVTVSNGATFAYAGADPLDFSPSSGGAGSSTLTLDGGTFVTGQGFQNRTTTGSGQATLLLVNGGTLALSANLAQLTGGAGTNTCLSTGSGSVGGTIDTSVFSTTISNLITGSGSLTKRGAGTLTLSAANNYTGGTTVSNGTLLVNGALGTGAVTVGPGATLGGTGTLAGAMTVNGTLAPGTNAIGILNTASELWNGGGGYQFGLNNATNGSGGNFLMIAGTLNIQSPANNPFTIKLVSLTSSNTPGPLSGFASEADYVWPLVTASGGIQNYAPKAFVVDTTRFSNAFAGSFSVVKKAGSLLLSYNGAPLAAPLSRKKAARGYAAAFTGAPPVAPSVNHVAAGGPTFGFSFSGPAGQSYRVLTSTNPALPLTGWVVATNGVFGSGPSSYSETGTNAPQKFYRIGSP